MVIPAACNRGGERDCQLDSQESSYVEDNLHHERIDFDLFVH